MPGRKRRITPQHTGEDGSVWKFRLRRDVYGVPTFTAVRVQEGVNDTPVSLQDTNFDRLLDRLIVFTSLRSTDLPGDETMAEVEGFEGFVPTVEHTATIPGVDPFGPTRPSAQRRRRRREPQTTRFKRPKTRGNPAAEPRDATRAEDVFSRFHARDPKRFGKFPFEIPASIYHVGFCSWVTYRSDKWNDGTHDYIHDIDSFPRVKCCVAKLEGLEGKKISVPQRIRGTQTLTQIGLKSLGIGFVDFDDEDMEIKTPRCRWYWSDRGKALICVQDQKRLVAIVWGGKLDVEARGIVG